MAKKVYKDVTDRVSIPSLHYCPLTQVIATLQEYLDRYGESAWLSIDVYDEYDQEWCVEFTRKETEKERDKRLKAARKARNQTKLMREEQDARDRALYEELKERFG